MSCGHCGAWVTISPGMSSSPVDSGWREYQQLSAEVLEKAAEDLSPRLWIPAVNDQDLQSVPGF